MPMLTCFRSSSMNAVISSVTTCRGTHAAMLRVRQGHLAGENRSGAERESLQTLRGAVRVPSTSNSASTLPPSAMAALRPAASLPYWRGPLFKY